MKKDSLTCEKINTVFGFLQRRRGHYVSFDFIQKQCHKEDPYYTYQKELPASIVRKALKYLKKMKCVRKKEVWKVVKT